MAVKYAEIPFSSSLIFEHKFNQDFSKFSYDKRQETIYC